MTDIFTPFSALDDNLERAQINAAIFGVNAMVTPTPGGGQAAGVQLGYGLTIVAPPATNWDSLQLPDALAGRFVMLFLQLQGGGLDKAVAVWPKDGSSDTLNGVANDPEDGFQWATNYNVYVAPFQVYTCSVDGAWDCNIHNED